MSIRHRNGGNVTLTLRTAVKTWRLDEFVAQEEARGVEAVTGGEYEAALAAVIRPPQSEDQTSHFPSGDDSSGT